MRLDRLQGGKDMSRWRSVGGLVAAAWFVLLAPPAAGQTAASRPQASPAEPSPLRPVLNRYCVGCHNDRLLTADLSLEAMDAVHVAGGAEVWEKVIRKLRSGAMPPPGRPRPDAAVVEDVLAWLETELDGGAALDPDPGRTDSVHRLNRAEYRNAIRDLLALDVDVTSLLPADSADEHGFDNIASMLSVSPTLLDRYLSAARRLSRLAVGLPPAAPTTDEYRVRLDQDEYLGEDLPFGSRGGAAIRHRFPVDGEYVIDVRLYRQLFDVVVGLGSPHEVEIRVDGERILSSVVGGEETGGAPPAGFVGDIFGSPAWERYARNADAGLEVRFPAQAGWRLLTVSFLGRPTEVEDGVPHPPRYPERDESLESNPWVHTVAIRGPYGVSGPGDTPSRRKIFVCRPAEPREEEPCAERILTTLAGEAYRRPATAREVRTLLRFYGEGRSDGTFDDGVQFALERLLADPKFLFRIEREPVDIAPGTVYAVSDLDLAARLSFFLWSSIPDAELLGAAARGELSAPGELERQVRRMLADERSQALVDNFVGQWLLLRNLPSAAPDPNAFPAFDENLREAFERETRLFVESMFREDRSVVDLLRANYTFLNERLARHYGVPNVYGSHFRRVTFGDDEPRGGLLGQGSFLTVTSYPNRTSPVLRGRWVLESLLGTPPPSPPADVPGLPDRGEDGRPASVRERLERHRESPACSTCHAPMDPLGFALENFDAVGGWRDAEGGAPVDSSAVLPDGTRFRGPAGLRAFLVEQRRQFVEAMTEKLLAYSLGRRLEYYDRPTVRGIVREAAASDHRLSDIILGIVRSPAFQMRRAAGDPVPARSAAAANP
ncbi:MAG: DUF1592 domain-containing protein [Acidobacteria bacterium]|nr:DUF1592 domain-containing protein [Acidobacteriota bacterium]